MKQQPQQADEKEFVNIRITRGTKNKVHILKGMLNLNLYDDVLDYVCNEKIKELSK